MTRAALLGLYLAIVIFAAIMAVLTYLAEAYMWTAIAVLALEQNLHGLQLLTHDARIERWHDVIGAWRRQDPNAWRRP